MIIAESRCGKGFMGGSLRSERAKAWKGGKHIRRDGYIEIYLQPEDFFFPMAGSNQYVKEHRLVMAKSIGRCLHRWEQVHHINGNIQDNKLENLLLRDSNSHSKKYGDAYSQGYKDGYEAGRRKAKLSSAK